MLDFDLLYIQAQTEAKSVNSSQSRPHNDWMVQ